MNKKVISLVIFVSMLCLAGFVSAQGIEAPQGVPKTFDALLLKIAGGVGTLIASLGAIMIIVAGILYLLSAGNPEKVGTAKKALIYAIAGIAIGLAAEAIVGIVKNVIGTQ